jgi:hypothetical protein
MMLGMQILALGQARKCGGIKPVNGIPISNHKVEIMFSNCNTHLLNSPKILSKELYAAKFVLRQVPILYRVCLFGFWLPLWYLQTLPLTQKRKRLKIMYSPMKISPMTIKCKWWAKNGLPIKRKWQTDGYPEHYTFNY